MNLERRILFGALALSLAAPAWAERGLVKFPDGYAEGVRYAVVPRGDIRQEIYTSRAASDAVRAGRPIPSGTVITLVDTRDGKLHRYVVMEKRSGWGTGYPPELRNGEWDSRRSTPTGPSIRTTTSAAALRATSPRRSAITCSRSNA